MNQLWTGASGRVPLAIVEPFVDHLQTSPEPDLIGVDVAVRVRPNLVADLVVSIPGVVQKWTAP